MGATYVVVDKLEDALTYHKANMLHFYLGDGQYIPQGTYKYLQLAPVYSEVEDELWAILVEEEAC